MARSGTTTRTETELAQTIRRQIGTQTNRRHLSRLPAFALQREVPETLAGLLSELDTAEREAGAAGVLTNAIPRL